MLLELRQSGRLPLLVQVVQDSFGSDIPCDLLPNNCALGQNCEQLQEPYLLFEACH